MIDGGSVYGMRILVKQQGIGFVKTRAPLMQASPRSPSSEEERSFVSLSLSSSDAEVLWQAFEEKRESLLVASGDENACCNSKVRILNYISCG